MSGGWGGFAVATGAGVAFVVGATGIAKTNTAGIQELKKNGLDITKLTHLSSDGKIVPKPDL